jgi:hypothetical protein
MPCSFQHYTALSLDQCPLYIRFGIETGALLKRKDAEEQGEESNDVTSKRNAI